MIDANLLRILCCPETHQSLQIAEPALVESVNQKIQAGQLLNRSGKAVTEKCDGGLLRADGKILYPIRNNIPIMLISEGIPLP
jgi:uncharacterized protein YbaR (Trm112 family)